jgi:hypothetical protein
MVPEPDTTDITAIPEMTDDESYEPYFEETEPEWEEDDAE